MAIAYSITDKDCARFWSKVRKSDQCWEWSGCLRNGYGCFTIGRSTLLAHRVVWEMVYGRGAAQGSFICHTCDNPPCVRPDHLFLGNNSLNMIDSVQKKRHRNARKTHCVHGHLFDQANTYRLNGKRECRRCYADRQMQRYYAQRYGVTL
jgi:hypothetical protein